MIAAQTVCCLEMDFVNMYPLSLNQPRLFFWGGGGGGRLVGVAESKAVLSDLLIMKDSLSTTQLQACAL